MGTAGRFKRLATVSVVSAVVLAGCGGKYAQREQAAAPPDAAVFTDVRDGKQYKTVKIGELIWMAENLNYAAESGKCYDNDPANCEKYGRLYDWETANAACPAGWRLPSDDDWTALTGPDGRASLKAKTLAGTRLKSKSGWNSGLDGARDGNGTDEYGFSALPGGLVRGDGGFDAVGSLGYWWATELDAESAWYRHMSSDFDIVIREPIDKTNLFSVRCVRNAAGQDAQTGAVHVVDETRFVIIFPDQEVDETGDVGWYASLTREAYEKLGIEVISFNERDGSLSFALDDGKKEVIDMKGHTGLLYKKGKKPISVGWLDTEGYSEHYEWKKVAEYLQMEESEVIKRLKGIEESELTDERDGQVYKTVKIPKIRDDLKETVWMAQNLNYAAEGSKCYKDDPANCEKYGRLYNWETAKTACPAGWTLPSIGDWMILMAAAGGSETAGTKLKSTSGWKDNGNGTDEIGFSALPGGYGGSGGDFGNVGSSGSWWSANPVTPFTADSPRATSFFMSYPVGSADLTESNISRLFCVRCVKE